MHKKEQMRLLKGLMHHLDNKTNIDAGGIIRTPADTYTSEERFDMEWNTFFQNYPQIVGLSGDLPGPDTFLTTEDFGVPVLAVRDSSGKFKAYANVCSHRGVTVESNKKGKKNSGNECTVLKDARGRSLHDISYFFKTKAYCLH